MVITKEIDLKTGQNLEIVDISDEIAKRLTETGLKKGIVTAFVPGSTAGLTTIEYEEGLKQDLKEFLDRTIPEGRQYNHDRRWHDGNGHSHIRSSLIGTSLTIPFSDSRLLLGTWQQVIFLDFDKPARNRRIILQFIGE